MTRPLLVILACVLLSTGCDSSTDKSNRDLSDVKADRFFLPTGDEPRNTANPTIEIDASGGLHMVYPAYFLGDAFYAFCRGDCSRPDEVSVVKLPTDGTVANVMIALDPGGRPRVLMSTFLRVYYATCDADCGRQSSWTVTAVLEHDGNREVSGEAFALTPDGSPRFVMHSYRAYLGIGAPPPAAYYVTCDADCHNPSSWQTAQISNQIWQESSLRITHDGIAHLATVATVENDDGSVEDMGAYLECAGDCSHEDSWQGIGLYPSYSDQYIAEIDPAISMELTEAGGPRVVLLGRGAAGERELVYLQCDGACTTEPGWQGQVLVASDQLGAGLDLAIDGTAVRFAYTAAYNILLAHCAADCGNPETAWNLAPVEMSSDMKPDEVIPYYNCTVAAWFLRHPSVAIGADHLPRTVYRAEDISGGVSNPDPNHADCVAGADMVFARFARLRELGED